MSLFNLSNHADLRRHEEVYASPKASFVFSGTGPNHGECHGPVSNQRNKEIVVRFGLGRKRNIVGFIPESNPHSQLRPPCRTFWIGDDATLHARQRSDGGAGGDQAEA
jgi:hypothetical protein